MKQIINNITYDTANSLFLGSYQYEEGNQEILDSLYFTPDGRFFRHIQYLPQGINCKNEMPSPDQIIPLNIESGLEWSAHLLKEDAFQLLKGLVSIL